MREQLSGKVVLRLLVPGSIVVLGVAAVAIALTRHAPAEAARSSRRGA